MPSEAEIEAGVAARDAVSTRNDIINVLEAAEKVRKNELDPLNIKTREDAYAALSAAFVHVLYCHTEPDGELESLKAFHRSVEWAKTILVDGGDPSYTLLMKPALEFLFPERKH